eukprot:3147217-Rhodomonas_salina.1
MQGRGGLRVGSWTTLVDNTRRHIKPSDRRGRLFDPETGVDIVSQPFCQPTVSGSSETPPDERRLFPVAQLVHESLPVQACS